MGDDSSECLAGLGFPEQLRWHMLNGSRSAASSAKGKAWSNKELAYAVGVSDRQVRNWLVGASCPFSTDNLERAFFGPDHRASAELRQIFRRAHCDKRYGVALDLKIEVGQFPENVESSALKDAVSILIDSLDYIESAVVALGEVRSSGKSSISPGDFKYKRYANAMFGSLKAYREGSWDEDEMKKPTYSDLCLNIDGMLFFRKSVVELLRHVLYASFVDARDLSSLSRELLSYLYVISDSVERLMGILSVIANLDPKSVPRRLHVELAESESAAGFVRRLIVRNYSELDAGVNIFRDVRYFAQFESLMIKTQETINFLCEMEVPG